MSSTHFSEFFKELAEKMGPKTAENLKTFIEVQVKERTVDIYELIKNLREEIQRLETKIIAFIGITAALVLGICVLLYSNVRVDIQNITHRMDRLEDKVGQMEQNNQAQFQYLNEKMDRHYEQLNEKMDRQFEQLVTLILTNKK